MTRGGRFLPGHDARLKHNLIEEALGGSKRAETKLEKLGWGKFLEAKRAKTAAAAKPEVSSTKPKEQKRRGRKPKAQASSEPAVPEDGASTESEQAPAPQKRRGRRPKLSAAAEPETTPESS